VDVLSVVSRLAGRSVLVVVFVLVLVRMLVLMQILTRMPGGVTVAAVQDAEALARYVPVQVVGLS
jgi:ABC-type branched-subunit amino acid transport system permease subunit